jgi:hypothetical protein
MRNRVYFVCLVLFATGQVALSDRQLVCATSHFAATCNWYTRSDVVISSGRNLGADEETEGLVADSAEAAGIDPSLLLAVIIRESGDDHSFDWLADTPLALVHDFSVGISNMQRAAFDEAKAYSRGWITYEWSVIRTDPASAIKAAAFLLAKRRNQLAPNRSAHLPDVEYLRIGYRAGYAAMATAERSGTFPYGMELFRISYEAARLRLGHMAVDSVSLAHGHNCRVAGYERYAAYLGDDHCGHPGPTPGIAPHPSGRLTHSRVKRAGDRPGLLQHVWR